MCDNVGIKCRPTISHSPQGSSIIERVHQVAVNMLRASELEERGFCPNNLRPKVFDSQATNILFSCWSIKLLDDQCSYIFIGVYEHTHRGRYHSPCRNKIFAPQGSRFILYIFLINIRWLRTIDRSPCRARFFILAVTKGPAQHYIPQ
jgi:hypothetical protein